jgi:four helix bundle protein
MRPHEKLEVWNRAVELVINMYKNTKDFPVDEKYGLTSQIRRAAISIPANIAEGSARTATKEFLHFISVA